MRSPHPLSFGWTSRRGVVVVFTAVLLVVLLGMVALCVDVMIHSVARAQLRTAADSAALAGAAKLASERRLSANVTDLSPEISAAMAAATSYAQTNEVLGDSPVIVSNPSNASGGDIVVGYLDRTNHTSSLSQDTTHQLEYNSVQITLSRNASRGGLIPTSFAMTMGVSGMSATSTSTATALLYRIGGFQSAPGQNPSLLPIVLDVDTYEEMIDPSSSKGDQYSYNPTTKVVTNGSDGVKETLTYPVKNGSPGNWGTIKIGVSNNSTSTLGSQIRYGITPQQLAQYPNSRIELSGSPPSITFEGNPGISSGIKDDLESIIGRPVTLPIYDQNSGNGNNATYRVIRFAPVRIMAVNFKGNPKYVIVQPAYVRDASAAPLVNDPDPPPAWTEGGLIRLHLTR